VEWQVGLNGTKLDEIRIALFDFNQSQPSGEGSSQLPERQRSHRHQAEHDGALRYKARTGQPIVIRSAVRRLPELFFTWATDISFDSLRAGPHDRDYTADAVFDELDRLPLQRTSTTCLSIPSVPSICLHCQEGACPTCGNGVKCRRLVTASTGMARARPRLHAEQMAAYVTGSASTFRARRRHHPDDTGPSSCQSCPVQQLLDNHKISLMT
jgi:hypothetical protein